MSREDFTAKTKDALAKRVAQRCSNPNCRRATSGPHADVEKAVNLGVASHITAAAAGGPRYSPALTPEVRGSILNGIWLCQVCAKLVDNDVVLYSAETLHEWKRLAEFNADAELLGTAGGEYLPQPASAVHTPLPRIAWRTYHDARRALIDAGWQPRLRHWSDVSSVDVRHGNGPEFWRLGYWEIMNAWGTGMSQCTFSFHDIYRNRLIVLTQGEELPDESAFARVTNWFFDSTTDEDSR